VSMLVLLAMAALAIDVANLCIDRRQAQQAADAAALAGVKPATLDGRVTAPSKSTSLKVPKKGFAESEHKPTNRNTIAISALRVNL